MIDLLTQHWIFIFLPINIPLLFILRSLMQYLESNHKEFWYKYSEGDDYRSYITRIQRLLGEILFNPKKLPNDKKIMSLVNSFRIIFAIELIIFLVWFFT